jgi:hypothetical protein
MPSRRDNNGQMAPLDFDLAKAELAVEWLPIPDKEFRLARKRWTDFVRGSKLLTPAQRQVGLAIADVHINRRPNHTWFNWAWPSHQTLANETGLSRRTVVSAVKRLEELGILKISHGGGAKGRGGRTDRYTLNMAGLARLEAQFGRIGQDKGVKILRTLESDHFSEIHESGEIGQRKMRNTPQEDVKGLPPTLLETPKDSVIAAPTASAVEARKRLSNVSKRSVLAVTSRDHSNLAECVGNGNLETGFERLQEMSEDDVNNLALRLRDDSSAAESIRREVALAAAPINWLPE